MKFALACYGARGDVEPSVVVGRELVRRGHDVRMAVPPNLVGFAEGAGVAAVGYGLDSRIIMDVQRDYWTLLFRKPWRTQELDRLGREISEIVARCWTEDAFDTLKSLGDGADLIVSGYGFEQFPFNVAEYYDIPFAMLHWFPIRANGKVMPLLPARLGRAAMRGYERLTWGGPAKKAEDAQRRLLGLPAATRPWPRRIEERGSLEIQGYDRLFVPGLEAEWAQWNGKRPLVGTLTLGFPQDADDEVLSWIAAGTPPICFAFGSLAVESASSVLAMIAAACARLGERALVCAGVSDFTDIHEFDHVKVVGAVNYEAIFPACRAVVHHGGAATTATCLRSGVPQVVLWTFYDQPLEGAALKRLGVGTSRRLSTTTEDSLVKDLHRILAPEYLSRARELAPRMTKPAESVAAATDLVENFARLQRVG
ncbi:glycosyltransferase [Mycobacterium sp. 1245805.9]|uniref:glycosyltransferase n=1 Tax=Mycobacterium sp. 1245805.9 TaxID=1856862 RepID=UPI0008014BBC|nr:glycosyltransferase [Mycobacterium sp. 1245805.9]OBI89515.1 glycosyl transferase family 1 [Mycobacterium sp. 1245805.9]